jgi:ABC-type sugar transport system ATPase subunit
MDEILRIEHVSKSFPGVKALNDISFAIKRKCVHALVGENGAGKSTLIKILAGIYKLDEGKILLDGRELHFKEPVDAQKAGISVIHQELKLSETLTVAENIFLGNLPTTPRLHLVDWKAMRIEAARMMNALGIDLDVDTVVNTLSVAKKQVVEICKAISRNVQIIIMDEPSATLTDRELSMLFSMVKNLKNNGFTIIYISHRMDEIFGLADYVTVLRDSCHIQTLSIGEVTREKLISLMVGRDLGDEFVKHNQKVSGEVILEGRHLTRKGVLNDVNLKVLQGEVLGIAGLVGSGRTELARALLGIDKLDGGEVLYKGNPVKWNFRDSIRRGLGLVPEDRKQQGLILHFPVKWNISMTAISKILYRGLVSRKLEEQFARRYIGLLSISTPDTSTETQYLSGGNQQKVVIARWLMQDSEVLIMDEPTRGVDVGAKREIYALIAEMISLGKTIIVISSEMPELIGICDRIIVMSGGVITGEFNYGKVTQENILSCCV